MNWNIFQWRSLKTRVTVLTLAIFVISIWSLEFYISRMLREDMQRLLGEQQFSTVSFIAAAVNGELDFRFQSLKDVAGQVSPAMLGNTAAMQVLLEQRAVFQMLFNGGTFVAGMDGTATASVPLSAGRRGVNYMDRDFIVAALKEGKATIARPVMGKQLGSPIFVMAVPIRNAHGKVIGVLAGVTDLSKPSFLDNVTQNSYGKTGAYLLNAPKHRLIVTSSDKSRRMQPLPPPGVNKMLDRYIEGYEGYGFAVDSRGVEMLNAAKGIPAAGWFVAVVLPTAEAFAPVRLMQQRMLLATIFLTLLTGALTWWVLGRQLAPTLAAARKLDSLSDSDQAPQPLPITRQDEVGQLIDGFNRLLETLGKREAALQETLVERKRADAELEQHRERLEEMVLERTAQLRTMTTELAMAEERERREIAQDLHDDLGQSLAVIRLRLTSLTQGLKGGDGDLMRQVQQINDMVEQANHSVRSLSIQLSPPVLSRLGLVPALESLAEEMLRTHGLNVHIRDDAKPLQLGEAMSSSLYRIVRELLINVSKHAQSDDAEVYIFTDGDKLVITVADSGIGFDAKQGLPTSADGGYGLFSVRERLLYLGGDVQIDSRPGDGTSVVVTVPLEGIKGRADD